MKCRTSTRKLIALVPLAIVFILCVVISTYWYSPKGPPNPITISWILAVFVFHPIALISGTSLAFYIAEAFGVVRIIRRRWLSIVLLIVIPLYCIWTFLSFCTVFSGMIFSGDDLIVNMAKLAGNLPKEIFSEQAGFAFMAHIHDYSVTLVCEALGLGLFLAVGRKDPHD